MVISNSGLALQLWAEMMSEIGELLDRCKFFSVVSVHSKWENAGLNFVFVLVLFEKTGAFLLAEF